MENFSLASGIIAVILTTAWAIYVLFFKKEEQLYHYITVNNNTDFFRPGDIVKVDGKEFVVREINSRSSMTVVKNKKKWFGERR